MPTVACDRCSKGLTVPDYLAPFFIGWVKKNPDFKPGVFGWTCPACIGQPVLVPTKGKRGRKR